MSVLGLEGKSVYCVWRGIKDRGWRGSQCTGFGGEVNVLGLEGHQRQEVEGKGDQRQEVEGKSVYWVWRGIKDRRWRGSQCTGFGGASKIGGRGEVSVLGL